MLTPLSSLQVSKYHLPAFGNFPNTSLRPYPLMIYHSAFLSSHPSFSAKSIEDHLVKIGVVKPAWRYTMYKQHHYHSNVDEVLVIIDGSAKLCFGGSTSNPAKVETEVERGDVIIIPAGVGHALLEDHGEFQMIGSYPNKSKHWDMCIGNNDEQIKKWNNVKELKWFENDPIYGDQGPVVDVKKEDE